MLLIAVIVVVIIVVAIYIGKNYSSHSPPQTFSAASGTVVKFPCAVGAIKIQSASYATSTNKADVTSLFQSLLATQPASATSIQIPSGLMFGMPVPVGTLTATYECIRKL